MFVCAVALLCLVSLSHSAPLSCEDLIRPLDQLNPHLLKGRWALIAGSVSNLAHLEHFKRRNSSSIDFSNFSNATSRLSYTPSVDAGGKCHYHTHNVTVEGSVFIFDVQEQVNLTVTFLYTSCPDCLVMRYNKESEKVVRLFLFSRRRELEQNEMEEVEAQVKCLSMPPLAVMDPNKELCPEQSVSDSAAAQTEEK